MKQTRAMTDVKSKMTIKDMKQPGTILHKFSSDTIVDVYMKKDNIRHDKSLCKISYTQSRKNKYICDVTCGLPVDDVQ